MKKDNLKIRKAQLSWIKKQVKPLSKKLEKVYNLLGWKWQNNKNTPTKKEIENAFLSLLKDLEKNKRAMEARCGGLFISIRKEYEEDNAIAEQVKLGMEIAKEEVFML